MKISQIGSRQFVHDSPTFTNRHSQNLANNLNQLYSARATIKNDSKDVITTAKEIQKIQRETDYIKDTGNVPPTWKSSLSDLLKIV